MGRKGPGWKVPLVRGCHVDTCWAEGPSGRHMPELAGAGGKGEVTAGGRERKKRAPDMRDYRKRTAVAAACRPHCLGNGIQHGRAVVTTLRRRFRQG